MKHRYIFAFAPLLLAQPASAEVDSPTQDLYNVWWAGVSCYIHFSDKVRTWQEDMTAGLSIADRKTASDSARIAYSQQMAVSTKSKICKDTKQQLGSLGWLAR